MLSKPVDAVGGATDPVRLAALVNSRYARRTVMVWVLSGLDVFGYYGFGTLAPLALVAKGSTSCIPPGSPRSPTSAIRSDHCSRSP